MSRFHAVILDFDGLILETEAACYAAWRDVFRDHGADYQLHEYQSILGSDASAHALFEERCGAPPDWSVLDARRRETENQLNDALAVQPGVLNLLDQACALGLRLGIASSSPHRWVDRHLATHGLLARFEAIVCRDDVPRAKPEPDLYLEALRRLGATGATAIAFEDSHNGSLAAKRAGLWCIAVPTDMTREQDFSHADAVVPSLSGLDLQGWLTAFSDRGSQQSFVDAARSARK